jgi:hypothetical protein
MQIRTSFFVACFVIGVPGVALATPKYNPFTYSYSTLGEGEVEIEQYGDFIPLRALNAGSGAPQWYGATQFQTEFEYGISDRLELGLYVSYVPTPSGVAFAAQTTEANGVKQRLRLRLAEEGEWPVDVALYGELVENEREIEIEAKIILQKRIEKLRILLNLWGEREYYFVDHRDWVINPTMGVSYQVTPSIFPGVEGWMRVEWPDPAVNPRPFNLGPVGYVGPTFSVNFGRFWWTTGAYVRVDHRSRTLAAGDAYGNFWLRNIVGIDL